MAIKTTPADFIVREELTQAYRTTVSDRPARFALYAVRKQSMTTHEMLDALAKRLSQPLNDLAAAGLKDKLAVTTQHVTVRVDFDRRLPPMAIDSPSFRASRVGYVSAPIDAQAIDRNRFEITLRNLSRTAIEGLHEATERLTARDDGQRNAGDDLRLCVPNYFGNQRFGSARAGQGFVAAHLVKGEFDRALRLAIGVPHRKDLHRVKKFKQAVADAWEARDWARVLRDAPQIPERASIECLARRSSDFAGAFAALPFFYQQLTVEAYQSVLWNRIATTLLIERLGETGSLWVIDDAFGQLVFPEAAAIPPGWKDLDIPMLGNTSSLSGEWESAAQHVLNDEGITVNQLRIPGMERPRFSEVQRKLFVRAARFQLSTPKPDERQSDGKRLQITIRFDMPRGGYATILLRALGQ